MLAPGRGSSRKHAGAYYRMPGKVQGEPGYIQGVWRAPLNLFKIIA